jgi:hypothetical protein
MGASKLQSFEDNLKANKAPGKGNTKDFKAGVAHALKLLQTQKDAKGAAPASPKKPPAGVPQAPPPAKQPATKRIPIIVD